MGNCCGSPAAAAAEQGRDNVRRKKAERLANWKATHVIALRKADLAELPPEVAQVPSPRVLDASDNRLERVPPLAPSLQRLVLSNNRLAGMAGMEALRNLKVLALDGNRIATLPDWVGELSRLETLSLGDNQLAALPPSLGRLQRLRQLLVPQNRLRALPAALGECAALEELDAHHNVIEEVPPQLGRLRRLKLLQLDGNLVAAVPPEVLHGCTALATLSLHDNPISPDALAATDGFAAYEARRQGKYTKTLAGGALLGKNGMDEGLDRHGVSPRRGATA
ncbi:hypothetical protein ABPG75_002142 [Micractinium tetrahymenae]